MNTQSLLIPARRIRDNGLPLPRRRDPVHDAGIDLYLDLTPEAENDGVERSFVKCVRGYVFGLRAEAETQAIGFNPDTIVWVRTGWALDIPQGWHGRVSGRSGLAFKGGVTVWHIGTIDARFQGELLVALWNASDSVCWLKHGDRIAQLVLSPSPSPVAVVELEAFEPSPRGVADFGSSGR